MARSGAFYAMFEKMNTWRHVPVTAGGEVPSTLKAHSPTKMSTWDLTKNCFWSCGLPVRHLHSKLYNINVIVEPIQGLDR